MAESFSSVSEPLPTEVADGVSSSDNRDFFFSFRGCSILIPLAAKETPLGLSDQRIPRKKAPHEVETFFHGNIGTRTQDLSDVNRTL